MTRKATQIIPKWEGRGNTSPDPALSQAPAIASSEVISAHETDEAALAVCFDKNGLAHYLGLSIRSLDRANAAGLLP